MASRVSSPLRGASSSTVPAPTKNPRRSPPEIRTILSTGSPSFSVWNCLAPRGTAWDRLGHSPSPDAGLGGMDSGPPPPSHVLRGRFMQPAHAMLSALPAGKERGHEDLCHAGCTPSWLTSQIIHQGIGTVNRRPVGTESGHRAGGAGLGETQLYLSVASRGIGLERLTPCSRDGWPCPGVTLRELTNDLSKPGSRFLLGWRMKKNTGAWSTWQRDRGARKRSPQAGEVSGQGSVPTGRHTPGPRPFSASQEDVALRHRTGMPRVVAPSHSVVQ